MAACPPETKHGLLCVVVIPRATDEYRASEAGAASRVTGNIAGEPPGVGHAALTRVQGGTLPDGDRRNAGDTT